jgi:nucleoside triphosphate diphosphatase
MSCATARAARSGCSKRTPAQAPDGTVACVTDATPLPPASEDPRTADLARLCAIMERLRRPEDGCPWDLKQSLTTLFPYLREELAEAAEAAPKVEAGDLDPDELREELGDLLFNVVFTVELCREKGWFTMADVVTGAAEKITRRHPHIFGDETAATPDEVKGIWARVKAEEADAKRRLRDD